jgi:polysaccharide biosynthesis/export protein
VKKTIFAMGMVACLLVAGTMMTGCKELKYQGQTITGEDSFLSPSHMIKAPREPELRWVDDHVTELDRSSDVYPGSVTPAKGDWQYVDEDYEIGASDILDANILDLYAEGMETPLRRQVSDSGYIDLPQLKSRIKAEGLTQMELVDAIKKAYSDAGILRDPTISVTILERRQQTFSVLGAAMRPGTYNLVRRNMRLLDALALSGGVSQSNINYIYVIRQAPAIKKSEAAKGDGVAIERFRQRNTRAMKVPVTEEKERLGHMLNTMSFATPASSMLVAGKPRWKYTEDGRWVKVAVDPTTVISAPAPVVTATPAPVVTAVEAPVVVPVKSLPYAPVKVTNPGAARPPVKVAPVKKAPQGVDPFGWEKVSKDDLVRVIAIDRRKLEQGNYRMNIVIRENDVIQIPPLEIGEFYMMGEVMRPGVYSLTGRKITIKQALAAAGNLGVLAWPKNSMLIRRVGKNQEQAIPIDLGKIMRGTAPDIYLKQNDIVAVGTHWCSSFLAVIRNAFRMTYGFGFIYDRNFADPLLRTPDSRRFLSL